MKINGRYIVQFNGVDMVDLNGPISLGALYTRVLMSWSPEGPGSAHNALRALELARRLDADTFELSETDVLLLQQVIEVNPAKWPTAVLGVTWRHIKGLDVSAVITEPKKD